MHRRTRVEPAPLIYEGNDKLVLTVQGARAVVLAILAGALAGRTYCVQQPSGPLPADVGEKKPPVHYPVGISPDSTPLYDELKNAHTLSVAHKWDEAASAYRAALEKAVATKDRPAQALAHEGLSRVFDWKADYVSARKEGEQALAILQSLQNTIGIADVRGHLGTICFYLGDKQGAAQYYSQALATYDQLGMLQEKAQTMRAAHFADVPDGGRLLEEALVIAKQLNQKSLQAAILQDIGDGLFSQGKLDAAQEKYDQAVALLRETGNEVNLAYVLTSEGRVQRAHGHPEKALQFYRQALALQEKNGDHYGALQSTNAIAVTYGILDDFAAAIPMYEKALAVAKSSGSERMVDFELGNLAAAYNSVGRYADALPILEDLLRKGVDHAEYRYESLGYAKSKLGRYEESIDAFSKAIQISRANTNWSVLLGVLPDRAEAEEKLGNHAAALADAKETLQVVEDLRAHLVPSDFMKRGFFESSQSAYGLYVRLLESDGQPGRALEVAEEARARAFLDLLATRELQTKQGPLEARAANPSSLPKDAKDGLLMRGVQSTSVKQTEDMDLSSSAVVQPFSLLQMQATARRLNSTLISYWVTPEMTYIWVVPPEGGPQTTRTHVSIKDLKKLITGLGPGTRTDDEAKAEQSDGSRHLQQTASGRRVNARGGAVVAMSSSHAREWRELYRLLIEPIEGWLPAQPGSLLTIEPHGPLLMLPFAALTDKQGRYLLERFSLNYIPAVSLLQFTEKKRRDAQQKLPHYLLVADPAGMPVGPKESELPGLPGSRREIASVARLLPVSQVTVLEGRQAAEDRVEELAGQNTVLHFATHGIIRDDQPFESYLALGASSQDPKADGRLTAEKIYAMELHADLVFLSACRSGSGKISGDGIVGLTRAFLYAGTPSVIASLWDVADEPTYRLVASFYRSRLQGSDKSRALRSAQLHLLRQLRAGQVSVQTTAGQLTLPEDPIFWAGFVLQGEP